MTIQNQITLCTENYKRWKDLALTTENSAESKKGMEKAFFWLELQTAFITLHAIERMSENDMKTKKRILIAKTNLSKKLADYARGILDEMKL